MKDKKENYQSQYMAMGMCIGMCLGTSLGGLIFENMPVGTAAVMSLVLCLVFDIGSAKENKIEE